MAQQTDTHQLPRWTTRLLPHIEGAEIIGRGLVENVLWVAVILLVGWFVIGIIDGFVSLTALLGAGGLAGAAETLRRVAGKAKSLD